MKPLLLLLLLGGLWTLLVPWLGQIHGQHVVLEARDDTPAVQVLRGVLARGDYLIIDRDTVLDAGWETGGDLIVWDALVRLEGRVARAIVVVQGTLALRPGARVEGPVAALDGLILTSDHADVGAISELPPDRTVEVSMGASSLRVVVTRPPPLPRLGLGGLFGFRRIAYDRVDALSVAWGPQWRVLGREGGPLVDGWFTLRSVRAPGGGIEIRLPLVGGLELGLGAERATRTNEGWVRGEVGNSIEVLLLGRDLRDYYESDPVWINLSRRPARPPETGRIDVAPYIDLRRSTDRSLDSRAPWAVHGRRQLERANLPIEDGTFISAEAGTLLGWRGEASAFNGTVLVEYGTPRHEGLDFTRWLASGAWSMNALWDHSLSVSAYAAGTITDHAAPSQRWSFLGGAATLPSTEVAALRGDHLVFIGTRYVIPLDFAVLPLVGTPALELLHATGTAWETGERRPEWEQNLGVGVAFTLARIRAWIDPAIHRPRPTLLFELALP